jgi:hypothetical protein
MSIHVEGDHLDAGVGEPSEEALDVRPGVIRERVEDIQKRVDAGASVPVRRLLVVQITSPPTASTR